MLAGARKALLTIPLLRRSAFYVDSARNVAFLGGQHFSLNDALTVSRSQTVASYAPNKAGLLVPFGANAPRITDIGLTVEPSSTNLAVQSQFAASWTQQRSTITNGAAVGPDNIAGSASVLTVTSTSSNPFASQNFTGNIGTTYTVSCFLKQAVCRYGYLDFYDGAKDFGVMFDLQAGSVVGNRTDSTPGTIIASGVVPLINGWYRCYMTFTATAAGVGGFQIGSSPTGNLNFGTPGIIGQTLFIYGYQGEALPVMTSYIPTGTLSVLRNTDNVTTKKFAPGPMGTILAQYTPQQATNAAYARASVWAVGTDSGTSRFNMRAVDTGGTNPVFNLGNGTTVTGLSDINLAAGAACKTACAWDSTSASFALNGRAPKTGANGWNVQTPTFSIGSTGGGGSEPMLGTIQSLIGFNFRLTDAQIQQLTR